MDTSRSIRTYPDIGQAAFGRAGRVFVSILLYMELFSCCVDFMILEADNLSAVFPDARLSIGVWHFTAKQVREGGCGGGLGARAPAAIGSCHSGCTSGSWGGVPWHVCMFLHETGALVAVDNVSKFAGPAEVQR